VPVEGCTLPSYPCFWIQLVHVHSLHTDVSIPISACKIK